MLLALAVLLFQTPGISEIQPAQTAPNEPFAIQLNSAVERGTSPPPAANAAFPSRWNLREAEPLLACSSARMRAALVQIVEMPEQDLALPAAFLPAQAESLEKDTAHPGDASDFPRAHGLNSRPAAYPGKTSPFQMKAEALRTKRFWYALVVAQHSAATFDAWTTRRVIRQGRGRELNPLLRPFANSGALYAAVQVAPALLDYLGKRMMTSRSPWVRRMWWVPQVAGTGASLWSGAHNLRVGR